MVTIVRMGIPSHPLSHSPNRKKGAQLYLSRLAILMKIFVRGRGLHLRNNAVQDLEMSRK